MEEKKGGDEKSDSKDGEGDARIQPLHRALSLGFSAHAPRPRPKPTVAARVRIPPPVRCIASLSPYFAHPCSESFPPAYHVMM